MHRYRMVGNSSSSTKWSLPSSQTYGQLAIIILILICLGGVGFAGYLIFAYAKDQWPFSAPSSPSRPTVQYDYPANRMPFPGAQGISLLPPMDSSTVFYLTWTSLSTSPVTLWPDSSGNGRSFTQSSLPLKPTFNVSSGVHFIEGQSMGGPSVFPISSDYTIIVVGNVPQCFNHFGRGCILLGASGTGHAFAIEEGGGFQLTVAHGSYSFFSNVSVPLNQTVMLEFIWSQSTFSGTFFINGINCGSTTPNSAAVVSESTVTLGSWNGDGDFTGSLYEVLLYASALNSSFRSSVETWFRAAYLFPMNASGMS